MTTPVFKRKRLLTRPVLKMEQDKTRYVKIEAAMFIGKDLEKDKKDGDKKKEPATIVNVINLETGEEAQIVLNAVVKSTLHDEYPNEGYVGRCFAITKRGRMPGKQYNPFEIEEIEDPTVKTDDAAPVQSAKGPAGPRK